MGGGFAIHKQTAKFYFIKPEGKNNKDFFVLGGGKSMHKKKLNPVI